MEKISSIEKLCIEAGIQILSTQVVENEQERKLIAKKKITKGEVICCIPAKLAITPYVAYKCDPAKYFLDILQNEDCDTSTLFDKDIIC